jgi:hypothetical protein
MKDSITFEVCDSSQLRYGAKKTNVWKNNQLDSLMSNLNQYIVGRTQTARKKQLPAYVSPCTHEGHGYSGHYSKPKDVQDMDRSCQFIVGVRSELFVPSPCDNDLRLAFGQSSADLRLVY